MRICDTMYSLAADVSPFDNSGSSKEGVSCTYKMMDGYAPIFAYIGNEGYLLNAQLREGKQHCQKDTPEFLRKTFQLARQVTDHNSHGIRTLFVAPVSHIASNPVI